MSRCRGRLARWTLRGALLVGGVFGVWGAHEAVADDVAHAVEAPSCALGHLLNAGGAILDGSVITTPCFSPAGSARHGPPARATGALTVGKLGQPLAAVETSAGTLTGKPLSKAKVHRAKDAAAMPGEERGAEAIGSATRLVVDLASPVVEELSEARLLERVGDVVRPAAVPIVGVLPPALAPVLGLTQPIIGGPAAPAARTGARVDGAPAPARADAPTAGAPAAIARPTLPAVVSYPRAPSPLGPSRPASRDEEPAGAGEMVQVPWPGGPGGTAGGTPAAPASTAGAGSAAAGTGIPADASTRSWSPNLRFVGCRLGQCDTLAQRSSQPDARPA